MSGDPVAFNNTSAVDICSCVYLIIYQALHSPTFRPHALINSGIKLLRVTRLIKTFRVFRVFKSFRYSKNIDILVRVFKRQKDSLTIVAFLAMGYIFVTALVMFNIEPDTFNSFFDAIYWATVSLTTVGYGDIYATSGIGKILTMISSLFGIAIVALPAGIITAGYMSEINADDKYN